jgi:DNA modification methylase
MTDNCQLYHGDVMVMLSEIDDKSVNSVITSPPYWQKFDYGFPEQWGQESCVSGYLGRLQGFMKEVARVLVDDGTVFVILGDTYKKKSLCGIPASFTSMCIAAGWILRNIVIWQKTNARPESVRDRFSSEYEFVFFLVKQRKYYNGFDSIRVPHRDTTVDRYTRNSTHTRENFAKFTSTPRLREAALARGRIPGEIIAAGYDRKATGHLARFSDKLVDMLVRAGCPEEGVVLDPFMGSGTTGVVALGLNRKFIGIEGHPGHYAEARNSMPNVIAHGWRSRKISKEA